MHLTDYAGILQADAYSGFAGLYTRFDPNLGLITTSQAPSPADRALCRTWAAASMRFTRTVTLNATGGNPREVVDHVNAWKSWCRRPNSNWRPADYESAALPTELLRRARSDAPEGQGPRLADPWPCVNAAPRLMQLRRPGRRHAVALLPVPARRRAAGCRWWPRRRASSRPWAARSNGPRRSGRLRARGCHAARTSPVSSHTQVRSGSASVARASQPCALTKSPARLALEFREKAIDARGGLGVEGGLKPAARRVPVARLHGDLALQHQGFRASPGSAARGGCRCAFGVG